MCPCLSGLFKFQINEGEITVELIRFLLVTCEQFGMFESLQLNDLIFQAPEKLQGYSNVALNATFQLSGTFKRKFLANQA